MNETQCWKIIDGVNVHDRFLCRGHVHIDLDELERELEEAGLFDVAS
jgi:hypothetical protein